MSEEMLLGWQVGAIRIRRVVEVELSVPRDPAHPLIPDATAEALRQYPWLYPDFVDEQDQLRLAVHSLLVEAPGQRVVVDTCVGNDRPRRATGGHALDTPYLALLHAAGWSRESVTTVICTHLHVDHVGWNTMLSEGRWVPTFPNARYLIGRREFEHWSAAGDAEQQVVLGDSIQPVLDAGLVELVDTDHRVSPEIRLTPTPGHTPGHVSVLLESEGASAVITGDVTHHPCQMAHPEWSAVFDSDAQAAIATRRRLFAEWADAPILVIGTHYPAPTAGYVKRSGASYRFET